MLDETKSDSSEVESVPSEAPKCVTLKNLQYLSYAGLIVGAVSISVPYVIAVQRGDVPAWLPYISDACGDPPQGAIFSMGMTFVGVMFMMGASLYYLILDARNTRKLEIITWLGRALVLSSILMAIGLFGVATNPTGHLRRDGTWLVPILVPHLLGAALFFTAGVVMMIILTYTTYLLDKPNWLNQTFVARSILVVAAIVGALLVFLGLPVMSEIDKLKPSPDHGRVYPPQTIYSAIGEWMIVIVFMIFVTTFRKDFSRAKVSVSIEYK